MGCGDRTTLVGLCDPAGRPRGTGFVADDRGTVVTSHEAVDGLPHLLLHGADGRSRRVQAADITAVPEWDLALLPTGGPDVLGVRPLPISTRERLDPGTYVTVAAHGLREARILGRTPVTYTSRGRTHRIDPALELALGTDGSDALRLGGAAVGGPVLDPDSGAVIAVLGLALRAAHATAGCATPLAGAPGGGPLGELLRRNATTVPGFGPDLNLAGALQLTAMSVASAGGSGGRESVERPDVLAESEAFAAAGDEAAVVLGLVGEPGTGRTTELAAIAARRATGPVPAPTLWLRGADLLADDASVADAVARTLRQAGRIVSAAGAPGDMASATPERVARLAADTGLPLLLLLDGPEEMPPVLAHRFADWTTGTVDWLRAHGTRLVVGCRPEHWETAGALCPPGALHRPARPAPRLPPAVRIADFTAGQAERARERLGLPPDALAVGHDRHPLTLRLLAEVREALPPDTPGRPGTEEVFGAHLDLMCLRIAVRIAAGSRPGPAQVRRLAARVAGQVHEAARRCLGPGQGELDRAAFEEIFPWRTGWAPAVLAEGLLVPAGAGYRFAHEEVGDWIQSAHLDLEAALRALVHRWHADPGAGSGESAGRIPHPRGSAPDAPSGAPSGAPPGAPSDVSPDASGEARPGGPRSLPVPRHRIGPVIQALLLLGRRHGTAAPAHRLADLIEALDRLPRGAGTGGGAAAAADAPPAGGAARAVGPGAGSGAVARATAPAPGAVASRAAAPAADVPASQEAAPGRAVPQVAVPGTAVPQEAAPGRAVPQEAAPGRAVPQEAAPGTAAPQDSAPLPDARWWAAHLLAETLLRVPDARPYLGVLRLLAGRVVRSAREAAGGGASGAYAEFGPWFWRRLRLPEADRMDLFRRLVPADGPPGAGDTDGDGRFLDAVARRLAAHPRTLQPLLCAWFTDERPLVSPPDVAVRPTVAAAAQALLYARRDLAVDELADALVSAGHPRADELLAALAEDEPGTLCRAVERWSRDEERRGRRAAAVSYATLLAPHLTRESDRVLLRRAALALLARPADSELHGPVLALLVADPGTRDRHLPQAVRAFTAQGPPEVQVPAAALAAALPTHPETVLAAYRDRLARPGEAAGDVLRALAGIEAPELTLHAAGLVRAYVGAHPADTAHTAAYLERRLEHGPAARALLLPLLTGLLRDRAAAPPVRGALAGVLASPGGPASQPTRDELLEVLLDFEQGGAGPDPVVLEALLTAAATGCAGRSPARTRALVHRTGMLLVRTPEGAALFDRRLVALAQEVAGFGPLVMGWLADAPQEWAAVVGPSTRRTVEALGSSMPMPMQAARREHGSLRPA
ncbi:trypsin-like peptidase domain-containing protein [Streptomyces castrisilvae]|uniref:Trypsin-like peptidase domain-containing protein n=1 Tax=Streptomyces castrisilvae TaxID=3033811 RepID=A0ABY9HPX1_9ACTN|nr:trypsin-like peptidase domain-containing protein [Streptomyces sp. Mut1]WLQ36607.1 trypsin-like peptidase domain-containing protein [Streptomyces sp. Mut1]